MSQSKHWRVYVPRIVGGVLAAVAVFFIVKTILGFINNKPVKQQKKIQTISLLKPPPPPPPPPKVEKPPEPEIKEKIVEPDPEPEPIPDTPDEAPARDLGLDAEGVAGQDGFGLAAHKGGNGLFGGAGNPFNYYGGQVKNDILGLLSSHDDLRRKAYTANIKIWLKADGSVERFELSRGSNDAAIDDLLNRALNQFKKAHEPPPPGMQQPIKFRISSRV